MSIHSKRKILKSFSIEQVQPFTTSDYRLETKTHFVLLTPKMTTTAPRTSAVASLRLTATKRPFYTTTPRVTKIQKALSPPKTFGRKSPYSGRHPASVVTRPTKQRGRISGEWAEKSSTVIPKPTGVESKVIPVVEDTEMENALSTALETDQTQPEGQLVLNQRQSSMEQNEELKNNGIEKETPAEKEKTMDYINTSVPIFENLQNNDEEPSIPPHDRLVESHFDLVFDSITPVELSICHPVATQQFISYLPQRISDTKNLDHVSDSRQPNHYEIENLTFSQKTSSESSFRSKTLKSVERLDQREQQLLQVNKQTRHSPFVRDTFREEKKDTEHKNNIVGKKDISRIGNDGDEISKTLLSVQRKKCFSFLFDECCPSRSTISLSNGSVISDITSVRSK